MSTVRPRRRLVRPATVLLAVFAGLAIGFGADVARSGGVGSWLARHGLPPPYLPQGQRYDIGERSLYLDCRGRAARRSCSRPARAPTARPGARSTTRSPRRPGRAPTTGRGAAGVTDARRTPSPTRWRTCGRCSTRPGRRGPSSSPATPLAARTPGCSPRPTADEVVGALLVDSFEPDIQDDRIHPLLGELQPEYEARARRPASARVPRGRARLAGQRAAAPGVVVRGHPARGPRGSPLRAAPGRGHERGDRDAWRDGMESLSPGQDDLHDRLRRRPQHPHRTAGHGDRCRASPRRRRSRPTDRAGYPPFPWTAGRRSSSRSASTRSSPSA